MYKECFVLEVPNILMYRANLPRGASNKESFQLNYCISILFIEGTKSLNFGLNSNIL